MSSFSINRKNAPCIVSRLLVFIDSWFSVSVPNICVRKSAGAFIVLKMQKNEMLLVEPNLFYVWVASASPDTFHRFDDVRLAKYAIYFCASKTFDGMFRERVQSLFSSCFARTIRQLMPYLCLNHPDQRAEVQPRTKHSKQEHKTDYYYVYAHNLYSSH